MCVCVCVCEREGRSERKLRCNNEHPSVDMSPTLAHSPTLHLSAVPHCIPSLITAIQCVEGVGMWVGVGLSANIQWPLEAKCMCA